MPDQVPPTRLSRCSRIPSFILQVRGSGSGAILTACLLACVTVLAMSLSVVGAEPTTDKAEVPLSVALHLGPLPTPPPDASAPPLHGTVELVPEIDPGQPFPTAGTKVAPLPGRSVAWREIEADGQGSLAVPGGGVHWFATHLHLDRWTDLDLVADTRGGITLYVDGEEQAARKYGDDTQEKDQEPLEASLALSRGVHSVLARVEFPPGLKAIFRFRLHAAVEPPATVSWSVDRLTPCADFDRSREVAAISGLAVSPQGKYVARRLTRRHATGEEKQAEVSVFDGQGHLVASEVGGGSARPVAFSPDGKQLLLARTASEGSDGDDLLLWSVPSGPAVSVVRHEPGLGLIRFSPDGEQLLLASTRGVEEEEADDSAAHRRQYLRERLPDYTSHSHLHLLDISSGMRRRLTTPGDYVLDDAQFLPDGRKVVYGITMPSAQRPWFHTEIRSVDLVTGEERLVATFVAGWEVRPQSFAIAPDGKQLAFIGPPEELGAGHVQHNVYNKQVWLLDLASGRFERITHDLPFAFAGGTGLPRWERTGRSLFVLVQQGARQRLARLMRTKDGWTVETLAHAAETVGTAALSADAGFVAYTASEPTQPLELHLKDTGTGRDVLLEQPNSFVSETWLLSSPQDASYTGQGGETIEAWWYSPVVSVDDGKTPLVLYYYGGAVPTTRAFNSTHQFFAANGYAVLVVNPRGASGYGDAFADHHAGDWGPAASGDILAGVDAFLAAHPEIDGERIGIYGGSYGGFMTGYLVTVTDRFAAAVSLYGISDLATYWGQGVWGVTYGDMALAGATPWSDPDEFVKKSPLYRADRVQTPLLLLHGSSDSNVTPGESEEFFNALSVQDKMVELVLFPGEGHGISGSFANRVTHRTMILEWFDRFLRDQPQAWEARWE